MHSKHFSLEDSLAIGVDRMQRNFGPLKQQVEEWQALQLSAASAKLLIYEARPQRASPPSARSTARRLSRQVGSHADFVAFHGHKSD
jgi:hypothetical protein